MSKKRQKAQTSISKKLVKGLEMKSDPDYTGLAKIFNADVFPALDDKLFSKFHSPGVRSVVVSYYSNIQAGSGVDQEIYEAAIADPKLTNDLFCYYLKHISNRGGNFVNKVRAIKQRLKNLDNTISAVAEHIHMSPTHTNRYIHEMVEALQDNRYKQVLKEGLIDKKDIESILIKKTLQEEAYDEITKPINSVSLADKIFADCEIPITEESKNKMGEDVYKQFAGQLFGYASLRASAGARLMYEGRSNDEITEFKSKYELLSGNKVPKSYKHNKRTFVNYIKEHKVDINEDFHSLLSTLSTKESEEDKENYYKTHVRQEKEEQVPVNFFRKIFKRKK